jgi:hypothetical protein
MTNSTSVLQLLAAVGVAQALSAREKTSNVNPTADPNMPARALSFWISGGPLGSGQRVDC